MARVRMACLQCALSHHHYTQLQGAVRNLKNARSDHRLLTTLLPTLCALHSAGDLYVDSHAPRSLAWEPGTPLSAASVPDAPCHSSAASTSASAAAPGRPTQPPRTASSGGTAPATPPRTSSLADRVQRQAATGAGAGAGVGYGVGYCSSPDLLLLNGRPITPDRTPREGVPEPQFWSEQGYGQVYGQGHGQHGRRPVDAPGAEGVCRTAWGSCNGAPKADGTPGSAAEPGVWGAGASGRDQDKRKGSGGAGEGVAAGGVGREAGLGLGQRASSRAELEAAAVKGRGGREKLKKERKERTGEETSPTSSSESAASGSENGPQLPTKWEAALGILADLAAAGAKALPWPGDAASVLLSLMLRQVRCSTNIGHGAHKEGR